MAWLRRLLPLLIILGLAWTGITPVQAHGYLLRSIPDANAMLASAPPRVELFFSEAVDAHLSKASVLDSMGQRVDAGDARVDPSDPTHMTLSLGSLTDGVYTVVWTSVSATDGHQTTGSFPFAVGKVDAAALAARPTTDASSPISWLAILTKGLLYLAAAAAMGGILFVQFVWNPSRRKAGVHAVDLAGYSRLCPRLALAALLVLAGADLLNLMVQAGQANSSWIAWPWQPGFATLLFFTRVGILGLIRLALALVLGGLVVPSPNGWNRWAGLGVGLLLLATFSLESHAAGETNPWVPILADWAHMVGVSVWVGGLFFFLGGMLSLRTLEVTARTRMTSILIPHFSILAMASVSVLGLTGIYAALLRISSVEALTGTPYGQALLLKLLIAAPMLLLGAVNLLVTTPLMRRAAEKSGGDPHMVGRFRLLLTGEVALGVILLVWVSWFTSLPPAQMPTAPGAGIHQAALADDLKVTLDIDPGRAGINTFTATIASGGMMLVHAKDVSLEFTPLSGMVPPAKDAMAEQGGGKYRLQGGYLGMPDQWDLKVVVIRDGKFDTYADFKVDIRQASAQVMP